MKKMALVLGVMTLFFASGCGVIEDYLWDYRPEEYEQRLQERRERLKELEREQIAEQQRTQNLNKDAASRHKANQDMQNKLKATNTEITKLRSNLDDFKATNDKQAVMLKNLQDRMARLNDDLKQVETSGTMSDDEKRVEAERLKREIDRLVKEANILSNL